MICEHPKCTGNHRIGFEVHRLCPAAKARQRAYQRKYDAKASTKLRSHIRWIESSYNISYERYLALCAKYDGKCWICLRRSKKNLSVDHRHSCCPGRGSCGKCVRGVLCQECNYRMLGATFQEGKLGTEHAVFVAERVIRYLKEQLEEDV